MTMVTGPVQPIPAAQTGPHAPSADAETTPHWKIAVELVGAAAGVALILYFVGGLIFAARLRALDLSIDAGVALLPTSALLVAAVRALALALVVGGVVLLLVRAVDPIARRRSRRLRLVAASALVVALILAPVALPVLVEPMTYHVRAALIALALVAATLAVIVLIRARSHRGLAYRLAAIVLVLGTVLRGVAEFLPPTTMDFMSVRLKSGHVTDGYYLAGDSGTVFLVPNVGTRSIKIITAVPRSDVASLRLVREDTNIRPIGSELPRALVGRLATLPTLPPERRARRDELLQFGAEIRAHTGWRFPPIVPMAALDFLLDNYDDFYGPVAARPFPADGERVPLAALLRDPHLYVGFSVVAYGGLVVRSAPVWANKTAERRYLSLRSPGLDGMEASCDLTRMRPFGLPIGSTVDLHVTVLAWGSFNIRAGDPVEQTLLACAAGRPVEREPDRSG